MNHLSQEEGHGCETVATGVLSLKRLVGAKIAILNVLTLPRR